MTLSSEIRYLVWGWYAYRRKLIHEVKPNPAHHALAELERRAKKFTLVTQNVDNLHQRAGSQQVVELHGNIERSYCIECGTVASESTLDDSKGAPHCDKCGGFIRPDVVWFGEMLPVGAFSKAEAAARNCDVLMSIGTSAVVYPAASLPYVALDHGAYVVEVNREYTDLSSRAHETLLGKAGEILPELMSLVYERRQGEQ